MSSDVAQAIIFLKRQTAGLKLTLTEHLQIQNAYDLIEKELKAKDEVKPEQPIDNAEKALA